MIQYILNPQYIEPATDAPLKEKIIALGKAYLLYVWSFVIITLILLVIDKVFLVKLLHLPSIAKEASNNSGGLHIKLGVFKEILIVGLLAPLVEELMFRMPLTLKKASVALAIAAIIYRFTDDNIVSFDYQNTRDWIRVLACVSIFSIIYKFLPQRFLDSLRNNHFKYIFYISALFFGLIHILNFATPDYRLWAFYPFYVMPQISMGLFMGTLRMKYGFFWGWSLHALNNLLPIFIKILF